ncbi:MAG: hypothetical protein K6E50_02170 [Lachnospiraceae bacterium]|nr:hypothetical protein [Lachnospiraceae bacterium]
MKRAEKAEKIHEIRRTALAQGAASAVCLALLILVSIIIPQTKITAGSASNVHYGSLLLEASYTGYVVVAVLAFALGILLTLLALQLRKLNQLSRGA